MKKIDQTFYELIRTGFPCRFFLDVEFSKILNATAMGDLMMRVLRNHVIEMFKKHFGKTLTLYAGEIDDEKEEKNDGVIVELDETNSKKFSRHVVVVLFDGSLFHDVNHVKEFASMLHRSLWEEKFVL